MSAVGHQEAGIDLGGLFKDFWTELSAAAFDPARGLFSATKEGLLYPNPQSAALHGQRDHLQLFTFVGQVLGKVSAVLVIAVVLIICMLQ
jgi:ubiquitin-protein ligase E3 C